MSMDINKRRLNSSYTDSQKRASYLVAFNPDKLIHYGSAAKKAMYLSSADMDLIEPVPASQANALASKLGAIVDSIAKAKRVYLGDIKSGVDQRFVCNIGEIKGHAVVGFRKDAVKAFVSGRGFTEEKAILELLNQRMDVQRFLQLQELMRMDQVLRWSAKEVKQGFKLVGGAKVYLADTIRNKDAMTKLDSIQWLPEDHRFVEVTNYFKVSGSKTSFDMSDYAASLRKDIVKTYYNGNLFKMCKRMLSLCLLTGEKTTSAKLYGIVHSGIGILYKVVADIKTLMYMVDHVRQLPVASMRSMIDGFKQRLGNIYEFDFRELAVDRLIDACKSDFTQLESLYDKLYGVLTRETKVKLLDESLYPLPARYFPK